VGRQKNLPYILRNITATARSVPLYKVILVGLVGLNGSVSFAGLEASSTTETTALSSEDNPQSHQIGVSTNRCIDCHEFEELFSHPVDIVPPSSMTVSETLPLINGRVTCTTCHETQASSHTNERTDVPEKIKRLIPGSGLCLECHDPSNTSGQDLHALSIGVAHLTVSENGYPGSNPRAPSMELLDTESDLCMTCHDGAVAGSSGGFDVGFRDGRILNIPQSEHPIGMYEYSVHLDPDGELTPQSMLDGRVRLFDNQVGCGSCHSVYSNEQALLVMSNDASQLCLSCHQY
jgi:predicted CXXCH cytochrome family protein